jgi:5'-deoxynucleotidase YfbR-like HD superfamily hydrolase
MSLSPAQVEVLRHQARRVTMQTRVVGDPRAAEALEVVEAFLEMTEPDPRLAFMDPSIMTASGQYFNFVRPEDFDWNLPDVAHGLAFQNRFGGHTNRPYCIAQHSVLASETVEDPNDAFEALLHDAHEFAFLDMMTPFKIILPDYRRYEHHGETVMRQVFGLPPKMSPGVKRADLVMLATEKRDLMHSKGGEWGMLKGVEPRFLPISPLDAYDARQAFLDRFWELFPAHLMRFRPGGNPPADAQSPTWLFCQDTRTQADCKSKFNNVLNFTHYPALPGDGGSTHVPDLTSWGTPPRRSNY